VQRWVVWLLRHYSETYACQQFRSPQVFFAWLAAEDQITDPMAGLRAPRVRQKPVPFFTSGELSALEKACRGNTFAQRRDMAIVSVFRATGIRLAELAGIRYHPDDRRRSDVDLQRREIYIRGKNGKDRIVRVDHEAARQIDRYLRVRARHPLAHRSLLWLGTGDRGPLTGNGVYQMVKRRGAQAGVAVYPHRFRHHFSHTWLDRGGAEGDLMELNGWSSPQMLLVYGGSARGARARRHYDLIMDD
jgi:site-specific recombinase XerD